MGTDRRTGDSARTGGRPAVSPFVRETDDEQNSPPWRIEPYIYGLRNVVMTASGSVLACNVPAMAGPLLAAAPSLLAVVEKIAGLPSDVQRKDLSHK